MLLWMLACAGGKEPSVVETPAPPPPPAPVARRPVRQAQRPTRAITTGMLRGLGAARPRTRAAKTGTTQGRQVLGGGSGLYG